MRPETLLEFDDIVIQCHDDPDADTIASGFALQRYLESRGKRPKLVYSGPRRISKGTLIKMVKLFHIDITHTEPSERQEDPPQLLITVDCQDGESNVTPLPRGELAAIDHHRAECGGPRGKDTLREVRGDYGACSTIVWSMLKDAGFEPDRVLSSALYYGLYMDTVAFKSLAAAHSKDQEMRRELEGGVLSERELKREISDVAEIGWDGFSSAVGRLIYRKIADYCENSSALREAYPEIARKLEDGAYVRRLYTQAERGIAAAQNDLGFRCLEGDYVERDNEQAVKWFRIAAEQGHPDARQALAEGFE